MFHYEPVPDWGRLPRGLSFGNEATSVAVGAATDSPADGAPTTKPPRTKQKEKVLTSAEIASPLSAPA